MQGEEARTRKAVKAAVEEERQKLGREFFLKIDALTKARTKKRFTELKEAAAKLYHAADPYLSEHPDNKDWGLWYGLGATANALVGLNGGYLLKLKKVIDPKTKKTQTHFAGFPKEAKKLLKLLRRRGCAKEVLEAVLTDALKVACNQGFEAARGFLKGKGIKEKKRVTIRIKRRKKAN